MTEHDACELTQRSLPALALGDLPPAQSEQMRLHVAGCRACASEYRALGRTLWLLDDMDALEQGARSGNASLSPRATQRHMVWATAAVAAALIVGVFLFGPQRVVPLGLPLSGSGEARLSDGTVATLVTRDRVRLEHGEVEVIARQVPVAIEMDGIVCDIREEGSVRVTRPAAAAVVTIAALTGVIYVTRDHELPQRVPAGSTLAVAAATTTTTELAPTAREPVAPEPRAPSSAPLAIRGRAVWKQSGKPVPEVPLQLWTAQLAANRKITLLASVVTDRNGEFRFATAAAGEYLLESQPGADSAVVRCSVPVQVIENRTADVLCELEAGFHLSGVLVRADGTPVAHRGLNFFGADQAWSGASTDASGVFHTQHALPAGEVMVEVLQSTLGLKLPMDGAKGGLTVGHVALADHDVDGVRLEFPWSGTIAGQVVDGSGAVVASALVIAVAEQARDDRPSRSTLKEDPQVNGTRTAVDGTFRLADLPRDRGLRLIAMAEGFAVAQSDRLQLDTGDAGERVVLRLLRAAVVSGRVQRDDASPAVGARLWAQAAGARANNLGTEAEASAGVDGTFRLTGITPGKILVRAQLEPLAFEPVTVEVVEGGEATVLIKPARPRLTITGQVIAADGKLPPHLQVRVLPADAREAGIIGMAVVDRDGHFTVSVPRPGPYRMVAVAGLNVTSPIEVQAGVSDVEIEWQTPKARLVVQVLAQTTGAPVAGADVILKLPDGGTQCSATNEQGWLPAQSLGPGRYEICACSRGLAPKTETVEITEDDDNDHEVRMSLDAGRRIQGRVVDQQQHAPMQGVAVALGRGPFPFRSTMVLTDARGRFTLDCLPPSGGTVGVLDPNGLLAASVEATSDDIEIVTRRR